MATPTKILSVLVVFLAFTTRVEPHTSGDGDHAPGPLAYDNLTSYLLHDYSVHNLPSYGRSIGVSLGITLHSITRVDEFLGVFTAVVWPTIIWTDPRLSWDPKEHSGIDKLTIPSDHIWRPDIILFNAVREVKTVNEVHAIAYSNGMVYLIEPLTIDAACQLDLTKYPYDEQNCTMEWGSWVHDDWSLNLTASSQKIDLTSMDSYVPNPTWDVVDTSMVVESKQYPCCAERYTSIRSSVKLRRHHPESHIASAVFSTWMILAVFLIGPPCAGERIVFAGFVFLSLIVVSVSLNFSVPWYTTTSLGRFTIFGLLLTAVVIVLMAICYRAYPRSSSVAEPEDKEEPRPHEVMLINHRQRYFRYFDIVGFIVVLILLIIITIALFA